FAERLLLQRKLEAVRLRLSSNHPALALFEVSDDATIGLAARASEGADAPQVVEAASEWLLAFSLEIDRTFPGSLPKATLRILVESVGDGRDRHGLARALGFGGGEPQWG
ncbi:MAG: hypothetical protein MI919_09345, partial [Holophagales bacterium]|nr:hypothetical protein [Holophagales bacterium]